MEVWGYAHYSEWPKGAAAVIEATVVIFQLKFCKVSYDTLLYGVGIITK
jgi:hypothetical protein